MTDQTPDEPTGMLCKACKHDLADHKTNESAIGYPCIKITGWNPLPIKCPCPFFQG